MSALRVASAAPFPLSLAPRIPPDAIFALTAQYNKDSFSKKVNLGQGTYRDENGQPWVLPSVAAARKALSEQNLLHEYLPIVGLPEFRKSAYELVLGSKAKRVQKNQVSHENIFPRFEIRT